MAANWAKIFDNFGTKVVSKTDVAKGAYVPTSDQRSAISAAGRKPVQGSQFDITVLFDPSLQRVAASYYESQRGVAANRTPEARMGGPFVSSWLGLGDEVLIGNVGTQLFALKLTTAPNTTTAALTAVAGKAKPSVVMSKAKGATGKPKQKIVQRHDFVRNPWVVYGALQRAGGKCEVPGCTRKLFVRSDDSSYLEVHHITPLAEGGDDTLVNAAAICPHCHRELHYGKDRRALRNALRAYVKSLP